MNRFFDRYFPIYREGEGGGAGGGGATPYIPEGLDDGFKGTSDKETIDKLHGHIKTLKAPTPYYPEGLAEGFRGKSDRETIEALHKNISERPKPPEKPEGYTLELPEPMKARFGDMKDDPVLPMWQRIAHKHGVDQGVYQGVLVDLYTEMDKAGLIVDGKAEMKKLEPKEGDDVQRAAHAKQRVETAVGFGKTLALRHGFSEGEGAALAELAATANGVTLIEKLMAKFGETGVKPGGNAAGQGSPLERQLAAMYPSLSK